MYKIEYAEGVSEDLSGLRPFDRKLVLDRIEEHLSHQPAQETRNKKVLAGLTPPWEHEQPIWELRASEYRVFYDVNEDESRVTIRAIRRKPPHQTTEGIL